MTSQPPYQSYPPAQAPATDLPPQQQAPEQEAKRSKGLSWLVEIAVTVLLAFALYWIIQTFVVQTYRVEGESMDQTLANGQHLLIDKLTPRFDSYSRGDIVVLHPPDQQESSTPYIKRVIGVAGDHIEVKDDHVWINGTELTEPYVAPHAKTVPLTDVDSWVVGSDEVFVMGDNRQHSVDSREFGVVATNEIIGRAWLRFWPLDSLGLLQVPTYPDLPQATASPAP